MNSRLNGTGIIVAILARAVAVAAVAAAPTIVAAQPVRTDSGGRVADSSHSIQAQPGTPSALAAVLTRACGDCHSNTMVSRWYTRVPPFSSIMSRGATEGRKAVNFSEWTGYSPEQQRALLVASCKDATAGKMPVPAYLRFRGDARLSAADVATICSAAQPAEQAPRAP